MLINIFITTQTIFSAKIYLFFKSVCRQRFNCCNMKILQHSCSVFIRFVVKTGMLIVFAANLFLLITMLPSKIIFFKEILGK